MHSGPASRAFQEAFPYTVPIFAGFWFVAFAYVFYMHYPGFSPLSPMIMAMIIFGGSPGICCRHHAAVPLCSAADSARCLHHPGPPSFLRHCSHGEVQRPRKGIGFIMTALFLVIFLEQWMKEKNHTPAFIGLGCSALALALFGKDSFLIPAMVSMVILIALFRSSIEKKGESL